MGMRDRSQLYTGFLLDRKNLRLMIKSFLDAKGVETRFDGNKSGFQWIWRFQKRHSDLVKEVRYFDQNKSG